MSNVKVIYVFEGKRFDGMNRNEEKELQRHYVSF